MTVAYVERPDTRTAQLIDGLCQVNFAEPRKPLPYAKIMPRRSQRPTSDRPRPGTGEGSVGGLGGAGD